MGLAISMRFDFVDDKGDNSFTKIRVPTGFAIADYIEFGQAVAAQFVLVGKARITRASIVVNVSLGGLGLKTVASSVSSVAKKLYLQFSTAVTGFLGKTLIPALSEDLVTAGSDDVDQTDPDVAALVTGYEDGIVVTAGTMQFTNGRGHDMVALQVGKEQFRRRKFT